MAAKPIRWSVPTNTDKRLFAIHGKDYAADVKEGALPVDKPFFVTEVEANFGRLAHLGDNQRQTVLRSLVKVSVYNHWLKPSPEHRGKLLFDEQCFNRHYPGS